MIEFKCIRRNRCEEEIFYFEVVMDRTTVVFDVWSSQDLLNIARELEDAAWEMRRLVE